MRKRAVAQLQESRFDLLEEVKTVNIGNEMAVTISIGVGLDGLTYAQNYEDAHGCAEAVRVRHPVAHHQHLVLARDNLPKGMGLSVL